MRKVHANSPLENSRFQNGSEVLRESASLGEDGMAAFDYLAEGAGAMANLAEFRPGFGNELRG
jgi:hypothetical protein